MKKPRYNIHKEMDEYFATRGLAEHGLFGEMLGPFDTYEQAEEVVESYEATE